jgi:hypothetical protein
MKYFRQAVLLVLGVTALAAHADVYKWKDKDGKTHFSDRPPADAVVTEMQGLNLKDGLTDKPRRKIYSMAPAGLLVLSISGDYVDSGAHCVAITVDANSQELIKSYITLLSSENIGRAGALTDFIQRNNRHASPSGFRVYLLLNPETAPANPAPCSQQGGSTVPESHAPG